MFQHKLVILRELVIDTLLSYTSILNAAVGNTVYNQLLNQNRNIKITTILLVTWLFLKTLNNKTGLY